MDILRKVTTELGYLPEKVDMARHAPRPSIDLYIERFGGLKEALAKAKLGNFKTKAEWRKDQALKQLKRLAITKNKIPSPDELGKANGTPCYRTYVGMFGSWKAALAALEGLLD